MPGLFPPSHDLMLTTSPELEEELVGRKAVVVVGFLYYESLFLLYRKSWIYALTLESSWQFLLKLKMQMPGLTVFPSFEEFSHKCTKRHVQGCSRRRC